MSESLVALLATARRRDPGRPVVTFYDDATGERVELSLTTFDNWVCKIANMFADELGADPGDRLYVDLPTHWLGPAVVVAGWTAGLVLTDDTSSADVRLVGPSAVDAAHSATADAGTTRRLPTVACSLRPLGGRFIDPLPEGWLDFAVEVPPQPDALMFAHDQRADADAMSTADWTVTMGELVERGVERAAAIGLTSGGRIGTDLNPADPDTLATPLLAPLAVDASVVLVVNAAAERRTAIVDQERVSCELWSDPDQRADPAGRPG